MKWVLFLSVFYGASTHPEITVEGFFDSQEQCMERPSHYHFMTGWTLDALTGKPLSEHRSWECRLLDVNGAVLRLREQK